MTNNKELQESVKVSLQERMASLEASNHFHRETIQEISSSLKEVVKTQHVLANQKEEIKRLVEDHSETVRQVNRLSTEGDIHAMKIKKIEREQRDERDKLDSMSIDLQTQKNRINNVMKIFAAVGTILVPVVSAIIIAFVI